MPTSTRITSGALNSDVVVSNGSVRIDGILVSSDSTGGGRNISIEDASGNVIMNIGAFVTHSREFNTSWIASNGFIAKSLGAGASAVKITVTHSATGV